MFSTSMPKCSKKTSYTNLIGQTEKYEGPNAPVRPRIAIIGAGVTGVSTACHILDAGYECHIFESGSQDRIGGIWSRVNATSKLQIHSKFYTFHPAVQWKSDYPDRQEILGEIHRLWNRYNLASRSSFNTSVDSTYEEEDGKWIVNDSSNGYFDGVIAAIGTCGELNMPKLAGQEQFKGDIIHSSELVTDAVKGKDIVVVGGGASAVEALEFACDNGAASVKVVARSEKWFIPRKPGLNAAMAALMNDPFGIIAWIVGFLMRVFFYKDLWELAPPSENDILSGTPIINSRVFELVRQGRASWIRGDVRHLTEDGIRIVRRAAGAKKGTAGIETVEQANVCILATGYRRRSLGFLPATKSSSKYQPPNWYLQNFPTENATICATNCNFKEGIASVGGFHIGIYTRFLLAFVKDPATRPSERTMKAWVDLVTVLKRPMPGGPMAFISAAEMFISFLAVIAFQPALWKWANFIINGPKLLEDTTTTTTTTMKTAAGEARSEVSAEKEASVVAAEEYLPLMSEKDLDLEGRPFSSRVDSGLALC